LKLGALKQAIWLEVLKINSVAPALVTQAFATNVIASQDKLMVFTSSSMASIAAGSAGEYIYRSSKAALNMFVARAAQELASQGVRTVAMDPGWVRTDMGGPGASISPQESVKGIKNVLDTLPKDKSGVYLRYDGSPLPW
jgi:NAD(P)-dependent dehydrogenase (short-subunit alcohol dehydrogenase family)